MELRSGRRLPSPVQQLANKLAEQELDDVHFDMGPIKNLPIRPFEMTGDINKWLDRFEQIGKCQNPAWADADMKKWLPLCLTTIPLAFFKSLPANTPWNDIKDALKAEYGDAERKTHLMSRLACIKQAPSETVKEFYTRLISLASSAYAGIDADTHKALCMANFLNGLRPEISMHVRNLAPGSLQDALRYARNTELTVVRSKAIKERQSYKHNNTSRAPPQIICYNCGKPGHRSPECWSAPRKSFNTYQKSRNNYDNRYSNDKPYKNDYYNKNTTQHSGSSNEQHKNNNYNGKPHNNKYHNKGNGKDSRLPSIHMMTKEMTTPQAASGDKHVYMTNNIPRLLTDSTMYDIGSVPPMERQSRPKIRQARSKRSSDQRHASNVCGTIGPKDGSPRVDSINHHHGTSLLSQWGDKGIPVGASLYFLPCIIPVAQDYQLQNNNPQMKQWQQRKNSLNDYWAQEYNEKYPESWCNKSAEMNQNLNVTSTKGLPSFMKCLNAFRKSRNDSVLTPPVAEPIFANETTAEPTMYRNSSLSTVSPTECSSGTSASTTPHEDESLTILTKKLADNLESIDAT